MLQQQAWPSALAQIVSGVPDNVWIAVGAGAFLVLLLAIALVVRARKRDAARSPDEDAGFAWDEGLTGEPGPAAAPPAVAEAPAPVPPPPAAPAAQAHQCKCPACGTIFSVTGPKPIVTNCPGCGKKGYLR